MRKDYPYLPEGREIKYVPISNMYMKIAMHVRNTESTDSKHPTGAVVVIDGQAIIKEANQSVIKNKKIIKWHGKGMCIRRFLKIPTGQKYWLCPGCTSHRQHAESRAVRMALKKHGNIKGADLYLYGHWWCCKPCWDTMIKAGIRDVYLVENADLLFKRK